MWCHSPVIWGETPHTIIAMLLLAHLYNATDNDLPVAKYWSSNKSQSRHAEKKIENPYTRVEAVVLINYIAVVLINYIMASRFVQKIYNFSSRVCL